MGHHALSEAEQQRAYPRKNLYILHDLNFKKSSLSPIRKPYYAIIKLFIQVYIDIERTIEVLQQRMLRIFL